MAVIHAAHPKLFAQTPSGCIDPIDRCGDGSRHPEIGGKSGFDLPDRAILTSESEILKPCWYSTIGVVRQSPAAVFRSLLFEESIMIGSPPKPIFAQSTQNHDWDARATEVIAEARKMPFGQRRSDALGEAGRLRIAAEMKRWLSTK
jgi:hypothetical protein